MTEPQPAPTAPKKGLPVLAWVAIGCAGLIVVAGILFVAGGAFVFKKVKDKVGENPALAAAELIVRANPELELVESDAEAGTLTIRNKKTNEVLTVDLEAVKEGRIGFKTGDQESTITFGGTGEEGRMTITGPGGETTFQAGAGGAVEIPDWVPVYGGATPAGTYRMSAGGETTGGFTLTTGDAAEAVLDFYGGALEDLGGEVQRQTYSTGGDEGGMVGGGTPDERRKLSVIVNQRGGETSVTVTYTEKS